MIIEDDVFINKNRGMSRHYYFEPEMVLWKRMNREINKNHPQYAEYRAKGNQLLEAHKRQVDALKDKAHPKKTTEWDIRQIELETNAKIKQLIEEYAFLWDE